MTWLFTIFNLKCNHICICHYSVIVKMITDHLSFKKFKNVNLPKFCGANPIFKAKMLINLGHHSIRREVHRIHTPSPFSGTKFLFLFDLISLSKENLQRTYRYQWETLEKLRDRDVQWGWNSSPYYQPNGPIIYEMYTRKGKTYLDFRDYGKWVFSYYSNLCQVLLYANSFVQKKKFH